MSEEAKKEINEMELKEIYEVYATLKEAKKTVESSIVEIDPEDLKTKRKKRGSKN